MSADDLPDAAVSDPQDVPADVAVAEVWPVDIAGTPAVVVLPRVTLALVAADGHLVSADLLETAVREHGGRPVDVPPDFTGAPTPGWRAVLSPATGLTVTNPQARPLYAGPLHADPDWWADVRRDLAATGGLVVLAGAMTAPSDIAAAVAQGRATWIRAATD
ncbi:hypothetical protein [Nocardia wallacei]|uniref:hypothetical protein n=1 Tax=Nocardia wallacei TaxID=480035 RepID=UPI0024584826|nr:hypothetical protein [Nocardia wallacei]